jgi:hypothetical protein
MGFKIKMDTHINLKLERVHHLYYKLMGEVTIKTKSDYETRILNQFRNLLFKAKLIQSP